MSCNDKLEWVAYSLASDVFYVSLQKVHPTAPDPRKSRADQQVGLEEAAKNDVYDKSEREKTCGSKCLQGPLVDAPTTFPDTTVVYQWTEDYQGVDPAGTLVTLKATYLAFGRVTQIKHRYSRECAAKVVGNVSYSLNTLGEVPVDAALLAYLPVEELHRVLWAKGLLEKAEVFTEREA